MNAILNLSNTVFNKLDSVGTWLSMLPLRLLLAWEFIVAWASVHAGNGYNVCDNGY